MAESQGRYDEAEPLFARAVEILLQTLGQDHPNIQESITNFVDCLQKAIAGGQGDLLSAHPLTQFLLKEIKVKKGKRKEKKGFM